jgi:hypothetical protein
MAFKLLIPFAPVAAPAAAVVFVLLQVASTADSASVVAMVATIGGAALYIGRKINTLNSTFQNWGIEHEMLINDFCERNGIAPEHLPTRAAQRQAKARGAGGIL